MIVKRNQPTVPTEPEGLVNVSFVFSVNCVTMWIYEGTYREKKVFWMFVLWIFM